MKDWLKIIGLIIVIIPMMLFAYRDVHNIKYSENMQVSFKVLEESIRNSVAQPIQKPNFAYVFGGLSIILLLLWFVSLEKVMLGCLLFPCAAFSIYEGAAHLPVFLGIETQDHYIGRKICSYPVIKFANAHIPKKSVVLALPGNDETSAYYWDAKILYLTLQQQFEKNTLEIEKIIFSKKHLGKNPITHIFFRKIDYKWDAKDKVWDNISQGAWFNLHWDMADLEKRGLLKPIYSDSEATLYKVNYEGIY